MPKFTIDLERRFVQMETATITIEAKNASEARKLAKERMTSDDLSDEWAPSDSWYDHYNVEDVTPTAKAEG